MNDKAGHYKITNYAVIILAAGRSSRLGSPKQLLAYQDTTLLQHSINSAKQIDPEHLVVVLGSNSKLIERTIVGTGISIVENPDWESGIASSIKSGINALQHISPGINAVILMVCDQPFADAAILKELLRVQAGSGNAVAGCSYDGTYGTPALFHSSIFPELLALEGDSGAKKLFEKYRQAASFVPFKKGGIDIDTSEDYKKLQK